MPRQSQQLVQDLISTTADSIKEEQEKNEPELQPQGQEQQLHQDLQSHGLFSSHL
jgi:hypothetical protein